jgi:hypothetical protein
MARLFLAYLERLHGARIMALRTALEHDGGWPLHIDATGEDGRGTLFVAYAGWRRWVLGAWKLPTERADAIVPHLWSVIECFGAPCAVMRDLGRAMIRATEDIVKDQNPNFPVLACHLHFLRDIGKDLLDPAHGKLRTLFRRTKVRPRLCALARDLGRKIGTDIAKARTDLATWQRMEDEGHVLPDGTVGLAAVRALAQWVLDFPADAADDGFPFDRPYLDFHRRCARASRAVDAFLRTPPGDARVRGALDRLRSILAPTGSDVPFASVADTLTRRALLFDELRTVLRVVPKPTGRHETTPTPPTSTDEALKELRDIQSAVDALIASLKARRPQRGPAQDTREAIDLVLKHLATHGGHLWGHAIRLPETAGGGVRLVDRTNNCLEGFFHHMKHGERRRSGRKILTNDFEDMPAAAALARNLMCPDYLEIVCGRIEDLPRAFADLDAKQRLESRDTPPTPLPTPVVSPVPNLASAALPRDDRPLVRSPEMQRRVLAAANSRAPRTA